MPGHSDLEGNEAANSFAEEISVFGESGGSFQKKEVPLTLVSARTVRTGGESTPNCSELVSVGLLLLSI